MRVSHVIKNFLINGLCISTSLHEAVQMVAVVEVIFAIGFMCHGSYFCASGKSSDTVYGVLYLFSGITYWTLTWLLWMTTEKPTLLRCRAWILFSVLNQFLILVLMVTRNAIGPELLWPAIIWKMCGLFLQSYMIGVVWAFMLEFQQKLEHSSSGGAHENGEDSGLQKRENKETECVVAL